MPQAVAGAIVGVGMALESAVGAWLIVNSSALASGLLAAGAFGYSAHQKRRMERKARAAYNASLQDRTLTVRGTLEERDLVMGRVRKGGYLYPIGTTGADKEKFTFIVVMAGHSIRGVNTCYFDEHPLTIDADGWVTSEPYAQATKQDNAEALMLDGGSGSVTLPFTPVAGSVSVVDSVGELGTVSVPFTLSGNTVTVSGYGTAGYPVLVSYQYVESTKRFARVRWMLGSDSQAAFADLITEFPDLWTSSHRLRGCAYAVIELTYSQDIFPNGVPNFSADIDGADAVEDTRTSTTGFTHNPALLARWYLLHPLGGRRTVDQIDEASVIAAANVCDTSVNYGDGATALYRAGYVAKAGQKPAEVMDELCEAMAGMWGYTQGKVRMRAGAVAAPVATITTDWLLTRQMTTRARRPRAELRNVLQGTFSDADNRFQTLQFARVVDGPAVSSDGGELVGDVEFAAITRNGQAQQVAACMLRYERQAMMVTLTLKMRAWPLQLYDVVALTLPDMGWSGKLFEVLDRSHTAGNGVRVALKEIDASIYAFGTSFPVNDPAPNTLLPDPRNVPTVGTLTVTSSATVMPDGPVRTRVDIAWPAITDASVTQGGYVEVAWADARTPDAFSVQRADSTAGHSISGVLLAGVHHLFKARAVNGLGVRGDWSVVALHQVTVKTQPPADVDALTVIELPGQGRVYYWDYRTVTPDLAAFEARYSDVTYPVAWDAMAPLFEAGRFDRSISVQVPGDGEWNIAIRARNTSGNLSVNARQITALFEQGGLGAPVAAVDAGALGWPGTRTDCSLVGYYLIDRGTLTWDTIPTTWDAWLDWDGPSLGSISYQHTTVDLGSSAARRVRAGHVASGTVVVEYQSSTDGITYTAWAALPSAAITLRYIRVRWTVTGDLPVLYRAQIRIYS